MKKKPLWIERTRIYHFFFSQRYRVEVINDTLEDCEKNKIYVIKDSHHPPWLLQFGCPCGCGSLIHLNLLRDANPCWRYYMDKRNRITIRPSVHRLIGCHSHFNIDSGKIIWVGEER